MRSINYFSSEKKYNWYCACDSSSYYQLLR